MGNSRRSRRRIERSRVRQRSHMHDNEHVALQMGWCDGVDSLEEAKKLTHDALIEQMGRQRTSGVTWYVFDEVDRAHAFLDDYGSADKDTLTAEVNYVAALREKLDEHGGILVVASAHGDPSRAR